MPLARIVAEPEYLPPVYGDQGRDITPPPKKPRPRKHKKEKESR